MKVKLGASIIAVIIILSVVFGRVNVYATTNSNYIVNEQLQIELERFQENIVSKIEVQEMIQNQEESKLEEITQQLIDTQKSRIAILEGNISSLLTLLGVIVGVLTLFGGIFVWISHKAFSSKIEKVEEQIQGMKKLADKTTTKIETVRELDSNLNKAIRRTEELHTELNESQSTFDDGVKRINELARYIKFLELKISNFDILYEFEIRVSQSEKYISELEEWLKGTLPNYNHALMKVTEVLGANVQNAGSEETILEKLNYYIDSLNEKENLIRRNAIISLEWNDYVDMNIDDYDNPLKDDFENWEHLFNCVQKVYHIISAQISMNPD